MGVMASRITSLVIVYSTVYSGTNQRTHQSSASLAFVRGIHRGSVNSSHKWPVKRKFFPFHDVIINISGIRLNFKESQYLRLELVRPFIWCLIYCFLTQTFLYNCIQISKAFKCQQYEYEYKYKYHRKWSTYQCAQKVYLYKFSLAKQYKRAITVTVISMILVTINTVSRSKVY